MSFTNDAIKSLAPGATLYDEGSPQSVKGLHIRALAKGKSFMYYYRTKSGQQRRPKIGDYPQVTIAEARNRAKALAHKVAIGEDPKGYWDAQRGEKVFQDLFDFTHQKLWSLPRFVKSGRDKESKKTWENYLKEKFGQKKISDVTPVVIKNWHTDLADKPIVANRALEILSRVISFNMEHGHYPMGPNPCQFVKKNDERKRKRFATEEEMNKITEILDRDYPKHPLAVTFLWAMIMTGSRPKALEEATWEQLQTVSVNQARIVDGKAITEKKEYGILTFEGKSTATTGDEEQVILPPALMEKIRILPRIKGGTIFSCKIPKRYWAKVQKEVGCEDLWARDFRRWFASTALNNGVDIQSIAQLLNHKSTQTTKVYALLNQSNKVSAMTTISNTLETILQKEEQQ